MPRCGVGVFAGVVLSGIVVMAAAADRDRAKKNDKQVVVPPAVQRTVDFRKEVVPILMNRCARCHTGEATRGGFTLATRESVLKGGDSGEAVVVGKSGESELINLVAGVDPSRVMPLQGQRLSADQIGILRAWIDQGLKWDEGLDLAAVRSAEVSPRRPTVPPGEKPELKNPIDRFLDRYFAAQKMQPPDVVSDPVFVRRAYLDLIGLLPSPGEIEAFQRDPRPDRRERLVRTLLDNRQEYAEHWLTFWNDALRNNYHGTGFIDGGRQQITQWLYQSLHDNKPYNRFVHELLSPVPGSEGFVKGLQWRGVVNASQRPEMQAAQNLSQVFLGTNLKCASCHDSFVNQWKLTDAYALASVFADQPLDIHHCDKPTGKVSEVRCIFPQLGSIDPKAPKAQRMKQLADLATSPQDGRLTRTLVNRLWTQLFGRGLVEPVDDMDQPAWNPELLDWLAADFQDHGYDIKHTLETLCTSRAYQLPAVGAPRPDQTGFAFRGPLVRRMTAEQFTDAVSTVTGVWREPSASMLQGGGGSPGGQLAAVKAVLDRAAKPGESTQFARVRASLANEDPLLRALGRPNREQVVTRRDSIATTLEALELTNGSTLDRQLQQGAERWLREAKSDNQKLVKRLYLTSLARAPQAGELAAAEELLGQRPTREGMADLLWALVMLPEFQLIQ